MKEILWLIMLAAASYGAGSHALGLAKVKFKNFGEEALIAEGIGLIIFAYTTLFWGMIGSLNSLYLKTAMAAIILLSYSRLGTLLSNLFRTAKETYNSKQKLNSILIMILAILAVLNIIAAMAPVHASDAAAYHLALPKIHAEQGKISFVPFMVTSSYPMVTEMLFLDGQLLSGGKLGQMVAAFIGILTAIAIYLFSKKHFGHTTALIAAAVFYTLPLFSVFNIRGFVDISAALFGMLALYMIFEWQGSNDRKFLIFAGIFAGAAASTKISAYPIAAILFMAVAYVSLLVKRQGLLSIISNLACYGIAAGILIAPWLTRAFDYTGNPFYPLLSGIFGGPYLPAGLAKFWVDSLSFIGFGTGIGALLQLPWNLTMHSNAFGEQLGIGPFFLAFIPLVLLAKKVEKKSVALLAIAIALILIWFYTAQSLRYIFFVYAILSVVSAYIATRIMAGRLKMAMMGIVAVTIAINLVLWAGANNDEIKAVGGFTNEDAYISSKMSNYELLKFANRDLPDARLCLYGEIRGYYSDNDYIWCHPLFQGYIDFYTSTESSQILSRLKETGVTHLLVERNIQTFEHYDAVPESKAVVENANSIINDITANHSRKIYENEEGTIYEINYG